MKASTIDLIESFRDTQRRIKDDDELRRMTLKTQAGTLLYFRNYKAIDPCIKNDAPDISVVEDTTFHAASAYVNGTDRVCVLNFANAYSPGGGVRMGAMAQEECLCRSSNLYAALTLPYLITNYYKWNAKNTGDMGTDAVIYSPGVTVFKTDDEIPRELQEPFRVDVLTCAAPYNDPDKRKPASWEKLEEVFRTRIGNILEVAAARDVDVFVAGAFGCGAFRNPPGLVAEVFRSLLVDKGYGRYFKKIVFAIKKNPHSNTNFEVFRKAFTKENC